uniref:CCHC-type domain-containing protein n=1 Tax=Oncorhynchus kisutch TaxID=8019 RepID=A0A8C7D3Q8_ONCKI
MDTCKEKAASEPLSNYEVSSLAKNNFRVITVNMYNPHVTDEEVKGFLGRYVDNISSAKHQRDSLGFWNGRRGFQALLREDPKGLGGYLHPPAMFSLGADRGTLYYARQPPFCRRCMAYGHILASCSTRKCRFCGSGEHEAKDCDEPKACHGCGSTQHLWRDCPARHRSYALNVREDPPEVDKNEWQHIGTGQTIYTLDNTTQLDANSCKVDGKCYMAIASCNTSKIEQGVSALHRGFSYWKWTSSQHPKAKF